MIAIGDVHGCSALLEELLDKLAPSPDETVIFLGDYVDRGPDSRGVVERLVELKARYPHWVFLKGNHEAMMLSALADGATTSAFHLWSVNGGAATIDSYRVEDTVFSEVPEEHETFLRETRLYYETDEFFFVHAGLNPFKTVAQNRAAAMEDTFLWERSHFDGVGPKFWDGMPWEKTVVCGHTIQEEPVNHEKLICIDTGAFRTYTHRSEKARLTAVRLPEREFVQTGVRAPATRIVTTV